MPRTTSTSTSNTRKASQTASKVTAAAKASPNAPAFAEVTEDDFPTFSRVSESTSPYMEHCRLMVEEGKKFKLPVSDKDEADKTANTIRQVMRRIHKRSLTAVFVPNEFALYLKDGGEIKTRNRNGNGAEKVTASKTASKK